MQDYDAMAPGPTIRLGTVLVPYRCTGAILIYSQVFMIDYSNGSPVF